METSGRTFITVLFVASGLGFLAASADGQANANYALSFNGTNDLVIVPSNALLELTDGTLELWFRPDWAPGSIAYDPVLIGNRQGANLTRYSLQVDRNLAAVV